MRTLLEKRYKDSEYLQNRLQVLRSLYQNPMVFTPEHAKEFKDVLAQTRADINEAFIQAYDYIDDYTINEKTYRGKILNMALKTMDIYNEEASKGNHVVSLEALDNHNSILEALDNLNKDNKKWLEDKYEELMKEPISLDNNAVGVTGYKLINAYGENLENPEYVKLVKRIYKQLDSLVKHDEVRTFYVAMNKGVSICVLLALHHVKKTHKDIKVICVEECENVSKNYPRTIRTLYNQSMSVADSIVYIDEELNIKPYGTLTNEKTKRMYDWITSKTNTTLAVYTVGINENSVSDYLEFAKLRGQKILYTEV